MDQAAGMWYGFLSLFAGILGVMLVLQAVSTEPNSRFVFILGLMVFGVSFFLRILHLIYKSDYKSRMEEQGEYVR